MLHRVVNDVPAAFDLPTCYRLRGTSLTIEELTAVVDAAERVVPLDEVERALADGREPPPGDILTFDDGYREHVDIVAPMLAARGLTATFFVAVGLNGRGTAVAATDAWYWLLDHAVERVARVELPDGRAYAGRIDTTEGKAAWVSGEVKTALINATASEQAQMVRALSASVGRALPPDLARQLYVCPTDWRTLADLGMRVGAHSVSHPRLVNLGGPALLAEVSTSLDLVRKLHDGVSFAYPDGSYDDRVRTVVQEAGAASAVTCDPGVVTRTSDRFRLPRIFVTNPTDVTGSNHK